MMALRTMHDAQLEDAVLNRLWLHTEPARRHMLGFVFVEGFTGENISPSETYAILALGSLRAFLGGVNTALTPQDVRDVLTAPMQEIRSAAQTFGLFNAEESMPTPLHANNVWRFRRLDQEFRDARLQRLPDAIPQLIPSTRHTRSLVPKVQQVYDAHGTAPATVLATEDAEAAIRSFDPSTAIPDDLSGRYSLAGVFENAPRQTEDFPLYDSLLAGDQHPAPYATVHRMLMTDLRKIHELARPQ